jgi:hypothetical protein
MDDWNQFLHQTLWIIVGGAAFCLLVLLVAAFVMVRKMSSPEKTMQPIAIGLSASEQKTIVQHKEWLASNNLEYRANYQFVHVHGIVFQSADKPRFLVFMFVYPEGCKLPWFLKPFAHQRVFYRTVSYLEDLTVLDTRSNGDIGMLPRPRAYEQGFPGASLPEIWERHLEAEEYLSRKFGYVWAPLNRSFPEILAASTALRMDHTRRLSLYPLRIVYSFLWTRFRLRNRTVAQQYP